MAIDDQTNDSIRVINEEYERVLSNPDNVIMSDALQELMDLPMVSPIDEEGPTIDNLVLTLIDGDGLGVSVRGNLSELSCMDSFIYTVAVETDRVRAEFLSALEKYKRLDPAIDESLPLIIGGIYDTELTTPRIMSWSVENAGPHTFNLKINFRSEDVIF